MSLIEEAGSKSSVRSLLSWGLILCHSCFLFKPDLELWLAGKPYALEANQNFVICEMAYNYLYAILAFHP